MTTVTQQPARRFRVPFWASMGIWWGIWLALLVLLFSGLSLTLGPLHLRTLSLDLEFIRTWWLFISRGVIITFEVAVISIVAATLLAFGSALARLSRIAALNSLSGLYISLMRGTPLFLQFLFVYFALPQLGLVLSPFVAAVVALSLNYGAYMSEIFRAGIQAVPFGQKEAATALGMSPWQTMYRIVLPQAFRIVIPDIGNQFIAMQKDTALASAISLQELTSQARQAGLPRQHFFEALVVAAVWYWLLTIVLSYFQARLERRMAQSDRGI
ncbi:MAG TPA: amino acid ABC transporter permease [Roseiflexaceae bacterium]|nr:amino acid ABC transporter permease [Roseiflexaceae bacterium]